MMLFEKWALVTGSTRGIGHGIAMTFAKNGSNLILNGRNESEVVQLCKTLSEEYKIQAYPVCYDVSKIEEVKLGFQKMLKISKQLDILVNNAGIFQHSLLQTLQPELLNTLLQTNLNGAIYQMQYASRLMIRAQKGSIINICSIVGNKGYKGQVAYAASKAGLVGATLSAAKELAAFNIRVNAISPGFISTDMTSHFSEKEKQEIQSIIYLDRFGVPQDIANAALFLASDLSTYITGQNIGVDGGMVM